MSKMFDALRKAEEERRKRAAAKGQERHATPEGDSDMVFSALSGALPESFFREMGILRNSIDSALKGKDRRTLLFTSPTRQEGSTTISVNFAKLLAMHGEQRVLICEMNARNPAFSRLLPVNSSVGIGDVFSGGKALASVVQFLPEIQLYVAHIGDVSPNVIQLRLAEVFPRIVEEAGREYTTVIFDAPPITISPETTSMSTFVDGVVLVVQAGKTKREVVQRSLNALSQFKSEVLGIILNRKKYYIPEFLYKRV